MHKTFKYRISPNQEISKKLQRTLDLCRELYNAGLEERREAYRMKGISLSCYDQQKQLKEIKNGIRSEYKEVGAHVLYDVLVRLDKAFQNFFRRVKQGEKPGYPRFKGKNWYDSFTYPDSDMWRVEGNRLTLSKIGTIPMVLHRPIEGQIKTCTIKREGTQWYAVFVCEVQAVPLPVSYEDVGIDLGVTHFAALSTGEMIDNPRHYRRSEKRLARLQQALSRKKKGSHRRRKAVQQVAKAHRKIKNQRRDFQHKESRKLVNRYQVIVFEDLAPSNLSKRAKPKQDEEGKYLPNGAAAKSGLNKSIQDVGWTTFTSMVSFKAANAGRNVLFVNPAYTSQQCSGCGSIHKKQLSERWHSCDCGTELDRDHNAAINILRKGQHSLVGTQPTQAIA